MHYGVTYQACVLAIYGSGYSTKSCYTFTAKFLYPLQQEIGVALPAGAAGIGWAAGGLEHIPGLGLIGGDQQGGIDFGEWLGAQTGRTERTRRRRAGGQYDRRQRRLPAQSGARARPACAACRPRPASDRSAAAAEQRWWLVARAGLGRPAISARMSEAGARSKWRSSG